MAETFVYLSVRKLLLQSSREQLAVAEFANSLLVIPKVLASNAAKDSTELVAKLRAFHNKAQQVKELAHLKWYVIIIFYVFNALMTILASQFSSVNEVVVCWFATLCSLLPDQPRSEFCRVNCLPNKVKYPPGT